MITGAVFCVKGTEREDEDTDAPVDGTGGIVRRPESMSIAELRLELFESSSVSFQSRRSSLTRPKLKGTPSHVIKVMPRCRQVPGYGKRHAGLVKFSPNS